MQASNQQLLICRQHDFHQLGQFCHTLSSPPGHLQRASPVAISRWRAGLLVWSSVMQFKARGAYSIYPLSGSCDMGLQVYCIANPSVWVGSGLAVEVFTVYLALLYIVYFVRCMRRLRREIYQHYADPLLKLQVCDACACKQLLCTCCTLVMQACVHSYGLPEDCMHCYKSCQESDVKCWQ